jgi:hypothetical protein
MKSISWVLALLALAVSSCGHGSVERKAPCKAPTAVTAFGSDGVEMCGPIIRIDQDHRAVVEALDHLVDG